MYYYRLRDLREDKDKKQKDIAEILQTSGNYYGDYETGKRDIPLERAIKLAEYYDVSLDYLAGRTNDKGGLHCNYLDPEQKELLKDWKQLTERQKTIVKATIDELIDREPERNVKKSAI